MDVEFVDALWLESSLNEIVDTTKRSMDAMPLARLRRNIFQPYQFQH